MCSIAPDTPEALSCGPTGGRRAYDAFASPVSEFAQPSVASMEESMADASPWLFPIVFPIIFPILFPIGFMMLMMSRMRPSRFGPFGMMGAMGGMSHGDHEADDENRRPRIDGGHGETPLEVAQRRYASGEISREEFKRIREDMEAP